MPGLAGIITRGAQDAGACARLREMVACMLHEPFYVSGTESVRALGLDAGWVALEGSFSSRMPLWNGARDVGLIFAGEHYDDGDGEPTAGSELGARLIDLYERHGERFFGMLNGLFSGILLDRRRDELFLFNDRYGMGRIYYHEDAHALHFASEAKALLRVLPRARRLDDAGLAEFVSLGCVLQDRTLFEGVRLLPAGSVWRFAPGMPIRKSLCVDHAALEQSSTLAPAAYYDELKRLWHAIVPRYVRGSQRTALALTGGVDSRMILAWLPAQRPMVECYTFRGPYRRPHDVRIAARLATLARRPLHEIVLDQRFVDAFPTLADKAVYVSDGAADVKGACDLFGQQAARQIAPCRLSGVYGGEILRHLIVFKPSTMAATPFAHEIASRLSGAAQTYADELRGHALSFTAFKQAAWFLYGPLVVDRSQVTLRTPYLDNDLLALAYRAPPASATDPLVSLRLVADANAAMARIPTDRGLEYPPVPAVTRLRHLVRETTFRVEYAYDYGMPDGVARIDAAMRALHPERLMLGWHKFYHFRTWYRDRFATMLRERLLDPATLALPFLDARAVAGVVDDHLAGRRNHTLALHKLLTVEIICRRLLRAG
jgi:asparagine synthase (glutamine-hydrolysing)